MSTRPTPIVKRREVQKKNKFLQHHRVAGVAAKIVGDFSTLPSTWLSQLKTNVKVAQSLKRQITRDNNFHRFSFQVSLNAHF